MAPHRVVIVGFEGVELLDVTGPASVFATTTRMLGGQQVGYRVEIAAPLAGPFAAHGGVKLVADLALGQIRGPIDTLLIGGGDVDGKAVRDDHLAAGIARAARRARRITSVCTGALLLAKAGLLDGKRATTHWMACAAMRERHPAVRLETDPIFVRDGAVWTSAGVTSGIDLCLALVEEDHGRPLALEVARFLVLYLRRSGGQSQFSAPLAVQFAEREPLRELQGWIGEHLAEDLSVEALAARVHMSPRNFARVFRREVGVTPCTYVDAMRVDAARAALERAREPMKRIARDAGFGTPETMSRVFRRLLGVSPLDLRRRFGLA